MYQLWLPIQKLGANGCFSSWSLQALVARPDAFLPLVVVLVPAVAAFLAGDFFLAGAADAVVAFFAAGLRGFAGAADGCFFAAVLALVVVAGFFAFGLAAGAAGFPSSLACASTLAFLVAAAFLPASTRLGDFSCV